MFRWLLPKDVNFFDYFDAHAALIYKASQELCAMVSHLDESEERGIKIKQLEQEADQVAHYCIEKLHKTFITPFDRNDIHRLITRMDDIIDGAQHTGSFLKIYRLDKVPTEFQEMTQILLSASEQIVKLMKAFPNLKNSQLMQNVFIEINALENRGDQLYLKGIANLFENEPDTRNIMKWKEVYENIEDALDRCEDVANIVEGIILESS